MRKKTGSEGRTIIIMMDKKKVLSQILGPEEEAVSVEGESPLHTCVQELIECVHNKDVEGAVSAFKACVVACSESPEEYGG